MQARDRFVATVEDAAAARRRHPRYPDDARIYAAARVLDDLTCYLLQLPEDAPLWRALAIDWVREAHEAALDEFEHQDWALPKDYLKAVLDRVTAEPGAVRDDQALNEWAVEVARLSRLTRKAERI